MRISSSSQLNTSDFSDYPIFDNIVVFPDGSVSWEPADATLPEIIPTAACEVVSEWHLLPIECLQYLQPQPPEIFVTVPEFAPTRALKSVGRS